MALCVRLQTICRHVCTSCLPVAYQQKTTCMLVCVNGHVLTCVLASLAWLCLAWLGLALLGFPWLGLALLGFALLGLALLSLAWLCLASLVHREN